MSKELVVDGVTYVPKNSVTKQKEMTKKGLTYCIVRTYSAGVFAGWIDTKDKSMCQEVYEARRLWRWYSQFTLSALAKLGMKKGKEYENNYDVPVERVILKEIIEVIPCSEESAKAIQSHKNHNE